jgi:hypothetical protein
VSQRDLTSTRGSTKDSRTSHREVGVKAGIEREKVKHIYWKLREKNQEVHQLLRKLGTAVNEN